MLKTGVLTIDNKLELREQLRSARAKGLRIGFVPTMGALHEGHLRLVDIAKKHADFVVLSIFVNPTQFGAHEDLSKYPRTLETDLQQCAARGVDLVFVPTAEEMYGAQNLTYVCVEGVTEGLEGEFRPTHFRGVATVVAKLFNLVGECVAVFGRKDYQQLQTVRTMVRDGDFPVEIVGAPTVRESDGLAMSSRNRYLDEDQRQRALAIIAGIRDAVRAFANGERRVQALTRRVRQPIEASFDSIDYVEARDPETLRPLTVDNAERILIIVAARLGTTRLLDNVVLGEETTV